MDKECRREPREAVSLPLHLIGGGAGTTRDIDISLSGMFFEADVEQTLGRLGRIHSLVRDTGSPRRLNCQGQIVRVKRHGSRQGVAVKMVESKFEARA